MASIEDKINLVCNELEYRTDTDEYINQWKHAIYDIKNIVCKESFQVILNTQLETLEQTHDYRDENIIFLRNDVKELKNKICILEYENNELKKENYEIKSDITILKNKNNEYERNEKMIYVTQACLNMQKYVIKKVTGWNKRDYRKYYEQECGKNTAISLCE